MPGKTRICLHDTSDVPCFSGHGILTVHKACILSNNNACADERLVEVQYGDEHRPIETTHSWKRKLLRSSWRDHRAANASYLIINNYCCRPQYEQLNSSYLTVSVECGRGLRDL